MMAQAPEMRGEFFLPHPTIQVGCHELVVAQVRIRSPDPVDFSALPGTQDLFGIKAPNPREKPLSPQHFVDAWDASPETVSRVEDRGIAVRDLNGQPQKIRRYERLRGCATACLQDLHGAQGPHGPVPQ